MILCDVLKGLENSPPPLWLMRQAGRYLPEYMAIRQNFDDFIQFCFTPRACVEVTLQPIERFDFDAAIIFSDILVIPHVLGQKVSFQKNHGPVLENVSFEDVLMKAPDVSIKHALAPVYEAITKTRAKLGSDKALIGFAGAPWTIATYMLSGGKTSDHSACLDHPFLNSVMAQLETSVTQHLIGQIEAGCNVLQIFDSWASSVPQNLRDTYLYTPLRRIVQGVRSLHPNTPIIYFGRDVSGDYAQLLDLNLAFGVDQFVDLETLKLPDTCVLQGNLDPQKLVDGNFEEDIERILHVMEGRPHIFNLGHGILPQTPISHVEKLVQLVRQNS